MRTKITIAALAATALLALTACTTSGGSTDDGATFEKKDPLVVGFSVQDMKYGYWQLYAKGVEEAATDAGWDFVLSDQKSSEQTQVSGSADLINQGISGLIVSPIQPDALPATVIAAHAANIPIVIGDVGATGEYDAYVQSNNYAGGQAAAEYAIEQLQDAPGTKQVGIISLDPGNQVGEARVAGFTDEIAKHDDFEVVATLSGHTTTEGGFDVTRDMLASNPDIAAIYTAADPMALGSSQALEQAGKLGEDGVVLIGFNGDDAALDLISQGKMSATIAQDPYGQGQAAMQAIIDLQDGDELDFTEADDRSIQFEVVLVTDANVQDIKDRDAAHLG